MDIADGSKRTCGTSLQLKSMWVPGFIRLGEKITNTKKGIAKLTPLNY